MQLLKSVSNLLFSNPSSSASPEMITLEGVFYLTHPDPIRGQWECLYPDAQLTLRRTEERLSKPADQKKEFQFHLTVERIYDEDEDLEDHDDSIENAKPSGVGDSFSKSKSNAQVKYFRVTEAMQFHLAERDGSPTIRWMDDTQDTHDVYEFVIHENTSLAKVKAFKKTMLCCLYEDKYQRLHTYATESDFEKLLYNPSNDNNLKKKIPTKSSIHSSEASAPSKSSVAPKPRPQQSKPVNNEKVSKEEPTTPTTPKSHSSSAPLYPPPPSVSTIGLPSCVPLPDTTTMDVELDATFYLFNAHSFEFEEQLPQITVQLHTTRLPETSYLCLCDGEVPFLNQTLDVSMNHSFHLPDYAFVWNYVSTASITFSLALKFERDAEYHTFRKRFTELYMQATLHQSLLQMKLDDSDMDYLMQQRSMRSTLNEPSSSSVTPNETEEHEIEVEEDEEENAEEDEAAAFVAPSDSSITSSDVTSHPKNSLLRVGQRRTFVVRGNQLGVFGYTNKGGIQYKATVPLVFAKKKALFPTKALLHQNESNFIFTDTPTGSQPSGSSSKVYQMDLETQQIVRDWDIQSDNSAASNVVLRDLVNPTKQASDPTLIGILNQGMVTMDPRAPHVMQWQDAQTYKTNVDLHCATTTTDGAIAVGSTKGELRLFDRIGIRAKTQLHGASEPILHLDVSMEGHLVLATCRSHLLLFDVRLRGEERTGFQTRMAKEKKPEAIRLQLSPRDVALLQAPVHFSKAHFDTTTKTTCIVTSTGNYLVTWEVDQVLQGQKYNYKLKKMEDIVVDDQFKHGDTQRIIMALPDDVKSVSRSTLKGPRAVANSSSQMETRRSTRRRN